MDINVQDIMSEIYKDIDNMNLSVAELYGGNSYYLKCIDQMKKGDEIVVVGAGNHGKILLRMLSLEGLDHKTFVCDNNNKIHGLEIKGHVVTSIEDAVSNHPNAVFVITPMKYENELMQQLGNLGVNLTNIMLFIVPFSGLRME